jgi:hypothetical protein
MPAKKRPRIDWSDPVEALSACLDPDTRPSDVPFPDVVRRFKDHAKASPFQLRQAFEILRDGWRAAGAWTRVCALMITNELFVRSEKFRAYLVEDIQSFILGIFGLDVIRNSRIQSAEISPELIVQGLEFIVSWSSRFGSRLPIICTASKRLHEALGIEPPRSAPPLRDGDAAARRAAADRRRLLRAKYEQLQREFRELHAEFVVVSEGARGCLEILSSKAEGLLEELNSIPSLDEIGCDPGYELTFGSSHAQTRAAAADAADDADIVSHVQPPPPDKAEEGEEGEERQSASASAVDEEDDGWVVEDSSPADAHPDSASASVAAAVNVAPTLPMFRRVEDVSISLKAPQFPELETDGKMSRYTGKLYVCVCVCVCVSLC